MLDDIFGVVLKRSLTNSLTKKYVEGIMKVHRKTSSSLTELVFPPSAKVIDEHLGGFRRALQPLQESQDLVGLDLSRIRISDGVAGSLLVDTLREHQPCLVSLDLSGCGLPSTTLERLLIVTRLLPLRSLDLSLNRLSAEGISLIQRLPELLRLRLYGCGLRESDVHELFINAPAALHSLEIGIVYVRNVLPICLHAHSSRIQYLSLASCGLNDARGALLLKSLSASRRLEALCLRDNRLGDTSAAVVAAVLSASRIHSLNLIGNCVSDGGGAALLSSAAAFEDGLKSRRVFLAHNNMSQGMYERLRMCKVFRCEPAVPALDAAPLGDSLRAVVRPVQALVEQRQLRRNLLPSVLLMALLTATLLSRLVVLLPLTFSQDQVEHALS